MPISIDTEFTSLSDPRLIAIGAVAGDGRTFYGIVDDFPLPACTRFVGEHVLPALFAHPADAMLGLSALARAFCQWLHTLSGGDGSRLFLVVDDECDMELTRQLLDAGGWADHPDTLVLCLYRLAQEPGGAERFQA